MTSVLLTSELKQEPTFLRKRVALLSGLPPPPPDFTGRGGDHDMQTEGSPTKSSADTADLHAHHLISSFLRGTESFQSEAFPQGHCVLAKAVTSSHEQGVEAAVLRRGP